MPEQVGRTAPDYDAIAQGNNDETASAVWVIYNILLQEIAIREREIEKLKDRNVQDQMIRMAIFL
jgi:hypothetical protein